MLIIPTIPLGIIATVITNNEILKMINDKCRKIIFPTLHKNISC